MGKDRKLMQDSRISPRKRLDRIQNIVLGEKAGFQQAFQGAEHLYGKDAWESRTAEPGTAARACNPGTGRLTQQEAARN